jgi:hypothetical protein
MMPAMVSPCSIIAATRCTGTRVPRNTGSQPMMPGSLTTKRRARRSSRRGSGRSILRKPPSSVSDALRPFYSVLGKSL